MQTVTKPQIAKIHVLLSNLGMLDEKAEIIYNNSGGRTKSTKELTIDEARRLINDLSGFDPKERQKGRIFSLAYQAGIIYGSTSDDKKINSAKLTLFLKNRGAVKKPLNDMTYNELLKTHRQFEAIVKSTNKASDNKAADKAVRHLLTELNF